MSETFTTSTFSHSYNYPYPNLLFFFNFSIMLEHLTVITPLGRRISLQIGKVENSKISPDQQWIIKNEKQIFYVKLKT